jgi:hypothetical protein
MILTTHCQHCRQPLAITLDDATSEQDAASMVGRVVCVPCAVDAMADHTARLCGGIYTPAQKGTSGHLPDSGDEFAKSPSATNFFSLPNTKNHEK